MWRKDFLFAQDHLKKTLQIFIYVFDWFYFTQCLTSFSSIDHLLPLCSVFDSILSNIDDRFSQSTHLLMCLSLEAFMSITRTGLPILVELINLVNYVIISNELTLMVNSPTQIPDCDSHSLVLLDLFLSSDTSICSTMAFPWEILIMLLSQFLLTFHQIHNGMPHCITPLLKWSIL